MNKSADAVASREALPTLPQARASLTSAQIDTHFADAQRAFRRKDYTTAIPLLTQLLQQPEFPRRAQAQELMGLARVRERLRALKLATLRARAGGEVATEPSPWKIYGGASQIYRRDTSQLDTATLSANVTSQNALLNTFDTVARRRGVRFDFSTRVSAGYFKDMMADTVSGDVLRISSAFVELADREVDWAARLGRQSRNAGGLFGTFDGLSAGYQLTHRLRVNTTFGHPVESARDSFDTQRQFLGLALELGPFSEALDFSVYAVEHRLQGQTDRRAVGTELRYFRPGRTVVALVDYDLHYQELNNMLLLGTLALPARWTLSANIDRRKSPSLSLRNALIGQPVDSFDALLAMFSPTEIAQLARDRSADAELYTVSILRPFGERWTWSLDLSRISASGTPSSGGVEAVLEPGADSAVTVQGLAGGLFGGSDWSTIVLRHQTGNAVNVDSLGLSTRFPVWGALRFGPRLRIDRRELPNEGSQQWLYAPALRLELQRRRVLFEFESGTEIGRRTLDGVQENMTRYYFSLGYRMDFR